MKTITCPRCGAPISIYRAFRPVIKPFCSRCGWNLHRAELAVAGTTLTTKLIPIGIGLLFVVIGLTAARTASPATLVALLAVGAIVLIPMWTNFSAQKAIAAAKLSVNPALASEPFVDPALRQLQAMPRPRRLRFRVPGSVKVILLVALLIVVGTIYLVAHGTANTRVHTHLSGILVLPVIFVVLVIVPYFRAQRDLPLMRDGEMALGRVTYQQNVTVGKSSYSRIGYEYKNSSGQLFQDQAKDLTYSVYEDMTIPVFYDPVNPARNITPCASYLRVSTEPF
jgi:uncharacterized protein (DUF983 family)